MKDSDPRPMPASVRAAYRNPLFLTKLFLSDEVYSDEERMEIAKSLFAELSNRYSIPEVEVGTSGKTRRVDSWIKSIRKNPVKIIDLLLQVPEYGGDEVVMPILASLMQPGWFRYWESDRSEASVSGIRKRRAFADVAPVVLGDEQLRWILAQECRSTIIDSPYFSKSIVIDAAESAERFCDVYARFKKDGSTPASLAIDDAREAMRNAHRAVFVQISYLWEIMSSDASVSYRNVGSRAGDEEKSKYGPSRSALRASMFCTSEDLDSFYDLWGQRLQEYRHPYASVVFVASFASQVFSPSLTDKRWP